MEKNKENFLIYVLIFCVVLAFGGGYLLGNCMIKSSNVIENKDNNEVKENIDVDKLGKELFDTFSISFIDQGYYFFGNEKLTYSNINSNYMIELAINQLDSNKIFNNPDYYNNGDNFVDGIIPEYRRSIEKDYVIKSYKKLFGNKNEPDLSKFYIASTLENCECKEDTIYCYQTLGGAIGIDYQFFKYDYSKIENDKLNVYIKSLFIDNPDADTKFYSDMSFENAIDNITYDYHNLFDDNYKLKDEYFEKYKDKTGIYKMVFEKDTDGNYYWVETDIVKK